MRLLRFVGAHPDLVAEVAALVEQRWPQPSATSLVAQNCVRVDALRDQALVVGVVALVLSFLPVRRRLQLGLMSDGTLASARCLS